MSAPAFRRPRARRGSTSFDMLGLMLLTGLAVGAFWHERDPIAASLDGETRRTVGLLLDGRREAWAEAKPMLAEVDPVIGRVRVAVDRDADGRVSDDELVGEVLLKEGVHVGLPRTVPSRPFGAESASGERRIANAVLLRVEPGDAKSPLGGFYLSTTRALREPETHGREVLAVELGGAEGAVTAWRPDETEWTRRF